MDGGQDAEIAHDCDVRLEPGPARLCLQVGGKAVCFGEHFAGLREVDGGIGAEGGVGVAANEPRVHGDAELLAIGGVFGDVREEEAVARR